MFVERFLTGVVIGICLAGQAWSGEAPATGDSGQTVLHVHGFWSLRPVFESSIAPPAEWREVDFDDSGWLRDVGPVYGGYGSPGLVYDIFPIRMPRLCLRGKFHVSDPAGITGLRLSVSYRGGVVATLNGKEVFRGHMPDGEIAPETKSETYGDYPGTAKEKRIRKSPAIDISPDQLRKGLNVLALAVHTADIPKAVMDKVRGVRNPCHSRAWIPCGFCDLRLKVRGNVEVTPNTSRPKGLQVWNMDPVQVVTDVDWGDPYRPLAPIRLIGARGGGYSGQVVVGCDPPIKGLRASADGLRRKGGAKTIAVTNVSVRFPQWGANKPPSVDRPGVGESKHRRVRMCYWALRETAPAEVPVRKHLPGKKSGKTVRQTVPYSWGAVQPVWVTVEVPRDAAAGEYEGVLRIEAEGHEAVTVPLALRVINWTLPEPSRQESFMEFQQSPESLALRYEVPLWSDRHWELIEKTFRLLGKAGNKTLHIPLIGKTGFGNEQSMVRWKPNGDGGYEFDFSIVDRYLDIAIKHQGKPWVINFVVYDVKFGRVGFVDTNKPPAKWGGRSKGWFKAPVVTTLDPQTGKIGQMEGPSYMDTEAQIKFWRPLAEALRKRMEARGLYDSTQLGHGNDMRPPPTVVNAWDKLWPDRGWVFHTHGQRWPRVGMASEVRGFAAPRRRSDIGKRRVTKGMLFGWMKPREKRVNAHFSRYLRDSKLSLASHRIKQEMVVAAGGHGRGSLGADFFSCIRDKRGRKQGLFGRYPQSQWIWVGTEGSFLAPGPDGAISTVTFELVREGMQECEAKILLEKALFDEGAQGKLGSDWIEKCWKMLDARRKLQIQMRSIDGPTWQVLSRWGPDLYYDFGWQRQSEELYEAAADVARASGTRSRDRRQY